MDSDSTKEVSHVSGIGERRFVPVIVHRAKFVRLTAFEQLKVFMTAFHMEHSPP
jgi:hypothetical protein